VTSEPRSGGGARGPHRATDRRQRRNRRQFGRVRRSATGSHGRPHGAGPAARARGSPAWRNGPAQRSQGATQRATPRGVNPRLGGRGPACATERANEEWEAARASRAVRDGRPRGGDRTNRGRSEQPERSAGSKPVGRRGRGPPAGRRSRREQGGTEAGRNATQPPPPAVGKEEAKAARSGHHGGKRRKANAWAAATRSEGSGAAPRGREPE